MRTAKAAAASAEATQGAVTEISARLSTALADRYRIECHFGEGGMATVYLAEEGSHRPIVCHGVRERWDNVSRTSSRS